MKQYIDFVGLLLSMSLVVKPRLRDYWNIKDRLQRTPGFAEVMSRDKFFACLRFLHFADNTKAKARGEPGYNPLFKIEPVLNFLNEAFAYFYTCRKFVSVDESLIGVKNRTNLMQYLPNKKHHRWGIKLWVLCESLTGYIRQVLIYTGKKNQGRQVSKFGQAYDVVMTLVKPLFNKGYVIVVDNFFSGVKLAKALWKKGTYLVGTLRRNRRGIPTEAKTLKLKPSESKSWRCDELLTVAFREKQSQKKPVLLISTYNHAQNKKVTRASGNTAVVPEVVDTYNSNMGGVDLADQKVYMYQDERRSYKWYKKVFQNLLHRVCLNAYILYVETTRQNQGGRPLSREKFLKSLISDLIGDHKDRGKPSDSSGASHVCKLVKLGTSVSAAGKKRQTERDCKVCSSRGTKRKRYSWGCSACDIGVCRECFVKHTQKPVSEL